MTQYITTDDGIRLAYEQHGNSGPVIVLIHGWSGSRKYFTRNIEAGLAASGCQVYAYDQRFHGESDSPSHGFHVARLAADLRDFLQTLDLQQVGGRLPAAPQQHPPLTDSYAAHWYVPGHRTVVARLSTRTQTPMLARTWTLRKQVYIQMRNSSRSPGTAPVLSEKLCCEANSCS